MSKLTTRFNPKKTFPVYAYIDNQKRRIGYAYTAKGGSLCIKGDKMLDKSQLGRLLVKGVYVAASQ